MPLLDADDLVDTTEVAELLGLSSRNAVSVYRVRYSDFPEPAVQKGRCVLWARHEIMEWKAARS